MTQGEETSNGPRSGVMLGQIRRRRSWLVIVGVAALIARLPLLVVAHSAPQGDAAGYVAAAQQIGDGHYIGMHRTPGYPMFVWLCGSLPGSTADGVAIVQHLIGIALAVGLTAFGWRAFSPAAGVMAGVIAAISTPLLVFEDLVLADFLLGALVVAGALVLAACVRRPDTERVRLLVAVGALFAVATYVKPVGQGLILAAPIVVGLTSRDLRRTARATAVVGLTMILLLGPWAIRNAIVNDDFGLSDQLGVTLFNRAFEIEHLAIPADDPQSELVRRLVARAEREPGLRPSSYVRNELAAHHGFSEVEALAVERRLAETAIRRHALTYAKTSVKLVRTQILDLHTQFPPPDSASSAPAILRRPGHWLTSLGNHLANWWWSLTGGVLAALVLLVVPGPRRRTAIAVAVPPLLVIVVTVLTHGGNYRYAFQSAPEAWLLGSAGLVFIVHATIDRVRSVRRTARPAVSEPQPLV
jgi:4-amino-4-deoxy-L-arabinose transferase-like glycosyltransferase